MLACVALCIGAVIGAGSYAGLVGSAAAAARLAGRGDDPGAVVTAPGAALSVEREGGSVCVRVTAPADTALGRIGVRLDARACALDEKAEP